MELHGPDRGTLKEQQRVEEWRQSNGGPLPSEWGKVKRITEETGRTLLPLRTNDGSSIGIIDTNDDNSYCGAWIDCPVSAVTINVADKPGDSKIIISPKHDRSQAVHVPLAGKSNDDKIDDGVEIRLWGHYWPSRNHDLRRFGGRFSRSSSLFLSGKVNRDMRWIMAM